MEAFLAKTEACFDEALLADLPPFLMHPRDSTPVNATPYMLRYSRFRREAGGWAGRGDLLARLDEVMAVVRSHGLAIDAILLGGSFTELDKASVNDLDCLMFYRLQTSEGASNELAGIQRDAKARSVDVRFVPLDGDPLALIKLTSYFTLLYSKHKERHEIVRCLLLLDCREDG
jgi:hypothetical protein